MYTLMLVEDNDRLKSFAVEYMHRVIPQVHVITAGSCTEALRKSLAHKPDLVLLDEFLPDGDGLSLIKAFRDEFPSMKFIITSSNVTECPGERPGYEGTVGVLPKPYEMERLTDMVKREMSAGPESPGGGPEVGDPPREEAPRDDQSIQRLAFLSHHLKKMGDDLRDSARELLMLCRMQDDFLMEIDRMITSIATSRGKDGNPK